MIGAIAYAFTTLPIPEGLYVYGAKRNDATCSAQGFFMQLGSIACYLGVSLAVNYLLTIKYGWSETKLRSKRVVCGMYIPPIVIGLTYAGVGFLYCKNVMVWCTFFAR